MTHIVIVPADDWDRLMSEQKILVDAYNSLYADVRFLIATLEDKGAGEGFVYNELREITRRAHIQEGGV
jgi:hypothetical protein